MKIPARAGKATLPSDSLADSKGLGLRCDEEVVDGGQRSRDGI
jgi:hypothetical protein